MPCYIRRNKDRSVYSGTKSLLWILGWDRKTCPKDHRLASCDLPTEHQLNKVNSSDTEAHPPMDLDLCITNDTVSSKIYDKRDDFNFEIFNFPFFDGDVPSLPSYGA